MRDRLGGKPLAPEALSPEGHGRWGRSRPHCGPTSGLCGWRKSLELSRLLCVTHTVWLTVLFSAYRAWQCPEGQTPSERSRWETGGTLGVQSRGPGRCPWELGAGSREQRALGCEGRRGHPVLSRGPRASGRRSLAAPQGPGKGPAQECQSLLGRVAFLRLGGRGAGETAPCGPCLPVVPWAGWESPDPFLTCTPGVGGEGQRGRQGRCRCSAGGGVLSVRPGSQQEPEQGPRQ